jgi:hypothetical protein
MHSKDWMKHVDHLLSDSPLELFQVYPAGLSFDCQVTTELWAQLILTHGNAFFDSP